MRSRLAPWMLLALIVVVADRVLKVLIAGFYGLGDSVPVAGFFNLVHVHNSGAAFSFLADQGGWQRWVLGAISVIAALVLIWLLRAHATQKLFALALSLILGGAVGNGIDRLWYGYVLDFLDFHYAGYHFPAFNVADGAITLGVVLLVLDELRRIRRAK